jgi:hypothetical protein
MTDDRSITPAVVREEHLREVHQPSHWLYVASVLGLSFLVMLGFIALMGANAS